MTNGGDDRDQSPRLGARLLLLVAAALTLAWLDSGIGLARASFCSASEIELATARGAVPSWPSSRYAHKGTRDTRAQEEGRSTPVR
jgi:hypothetical protein